MSTQVSIKLHDVSSAARAGRLSDVVERDQELARLVRALLRPSSPHAAIIAEPGTGKSSLVDALAVRLLAGHYRPLGNKLYRLSTEPIANLLVSGENLRQCMAALTQATSQLESATIVVEDIQLLTSDDPTRLELTIALLKSMAAHPKIRLIVTTTNTAYHRLFRDDYSFARIFDVIELQPPTTEMAIKMTAMALPRLVRLNHQLFSQQSIEQAVELGARFGHGRALPDAAIRLLEETCIKTWLEGKNTVSAADVQAVVSERENLPARDLDSSRQAKLVDLEPQLTHLVVGQTSALRTIARTIAKSQLGLGDDTRPRGSFLLLGPSGVGKTETAKALTKLVYDNPQSLIRLDMSEYGEPHSSIRLIGSPPGYVGYEEGGQLTGAVSRQPYSLILLDEIEKAHSKVFDLFLQLLDDGRLTDSAGKTVDFRESLVLATSNTGAQAIASAAARGEDVQGTAFMQQTLMPLLLRTYRPEFINRFDAILVYQPLPLGQLVALAQRELTQLSSRLAKMEVTFAVPNELLAALLAPHANPLFGARPVRRLIATQFETPIADLLIRGELKGPVTITGSEPWFQQEVRA